MIYALRVRFKILVLIDVGKSTVRFSPKKNNTDTETNRLVYNELNC